jgi:hypothetical protein
MRGFRKHLSFANCAAGLALVFSMSGGAIAATGGFSSGGTLRACANEEGVIRLLKPGKKCKQGQKAVSWNQVGPAGAPGANGSAGAPGAIGATGAKGAQGIEGESAFTNIVVRKKTQIGEGFLSIMCEPGEVAIGGGGNSGSSAGHLYGTGPVGPESGEAKTGETPNGWWVQDIGANPNTVYAICAS